MNIFSKIFKKKSVAMEMGELYQYINAVSIDMERRNKTEVVEKVTVKEFSKWYSERIKEYENIINEAEQKIGLESVCKKGCSGCCKQAIYINPGEYYIIAKYVEQLGYSKKEQLKKQVVEALGILKQANVPMKIVDGSRNEQNRISELFFSCNIQCPFLSDDNVCEIYEIRPCVCWSYRNYKNKSECQECFKPQHSCAFVDLDISLTKEMYNHGKYIIKHQDYYLLIYALGKMLFLC